MPFIEFHAAIAEEPGGFLPEDARAMVLLLRSDGMLHFLPQRCIHGERP